MFLSSLFAVCSCNSEKDQSFDVDENWRGKYIKIPLNLTFEVQNDTIAYDIDDCDYKIIQYVNSSGCTGCKMNLPAWEQFMGELMSNQDLSIKLLLVVNTDNPEKLRKNLKKYHFRYPISLDTNNIFSLENGLGELQTSQTFLLNDKNEIVIIGNPVQNAKIKTLYLKELNIEDKPKRTYITITPTNLAMGVFSPKEEKRAKFRLFNNGDTPIVVKDVYTSCDCTSAWTNQDTIYPNSQIDIQVSCVASENDNDFIRYIHVSLSNDETLSLPLCGFVSIKEG